MKNKNYRILVVDDDIEKADIISASYEAFDFILRKGKEEIAKIGNVTTIIIDELQILDDGRGFQTTGLSTKSLGLGIMRERAASIGAQLDIVSHIGEGTIVKVIWNIKI